MSENTSTSEIKTVTTPLPTEAYNKNASDMANEAKRATNEMSQVETTISFEIDKNILNANGARMKFVHILSPNKVYVGPLNTPDENIIPAIYRDKKNNVVNAGIIAINEKKIAITGFSNLKDLTGNNMGVRTEEKAVRAHSVTKKVLEKIIPEAEITIPELENTATAA